MANSHNIYCDLDAFARSVEELVGDIPSSCGEAMYRATSQAVRKGSRTVKNYASKGGKHAWSGEYVEGFSSHVERDGELSVGEIGNKNKPGLVHLLEKGHVTLTGRRTAAFPHMAPAFFEIQEDFVERVKKYVSEAIS